jgi:hypothetical protein
LWNRLQNLCCRFAYARQRGGGHADKTHVCALAELLLKCRDGRLRLFG